MSEKILQLNFKFNVTKKEYVDAVSPLANDFSTVPGLEWKVWLVNEANREAGGIYLFEDETSLESFISGPLAAKVKNHPALSNMSMKRFDVLERETTITRGPIGRKVTASATR